VLSHVLATSWAPDAGASSQVPQKVR
jgi:hypothetical protein